ncbi:MAG: hypothetical protein ACOC6H_03830 [Thermoproteota archaeon]
MTKKENLYQANIPLHPDGTRVTVIIQATDHQEFTLQKGFRYTVGQRSQFPPYFFEALIILATIIVLFFAVALSR